MKFVYLASYPKSGNTWLRFLLHAAFFGPASTSAQIASRIPDLHRTEASRTEPFDIGSGLVGGKMLFGKSHSLPGPAIPGWAHAAGVVSIIRDPRDILRSALHFYKMSLGPQWQLTDAQYAAVFIAMGGDPMWNKMGFGTVSQHTQEWQAVQIPRLLIRYEDLKSDTLETLAKVMDFLKLQSPLSSRAMEEAVQWASMENMREMETQEKVNGIAKQGAFTGTLEALQNGLYFVNKGLSHQSLADIGPDLDLEFKKKFAAYMNACGYTVP